MKPLDVLAGAGRGRAAPNVRRARGWLAFLVPWLMIAVVVGRTTPAQLGWPSELWPLVVFGFMAAFCVDFESAWRGRRV
jgi:hypothetical protein